MRECSEYQQPDKIEWEASLVVEKPHLTRGGVERFKVQTQRPFFVCRKCDPPMLKEPSSEWLGFVVATLRLTNALNIVGRWSPLVRARRAEIGL